MKGWKVKIKFARYQYGSWDFGYRYIERDGFESFDDAHEWGMKFAQLTDRIVSFHIVLIN